jgi:hypothetical protein
MNIKTQTIIDYKLFKSFFIFKKIRSTSFIIFFLLNFLILMVNLILLLFNLAEPIQVIVNFLVIILLITIYLVFNYIRLQSTFNYEAARIGQIISYQFSDDYFRVSFEKSPNQSYALVKYEDLDKVYEFSNYLYIVSNKDVTYIINKGMYEGGTDQDLIKFLKSIIGLKYIKK